MTWEFETLWCIPPARFSVSIAHCFHLLSRRHRRQLRVNYSDRLVTLMREVRQLSELGYKVPLKITAAAETGEKFYRHALKLKQVANFYNTAGEQIIKSQQGLLLVEVDNFEKVVRSQSQAKSAASWDSPDECEQFVARLQDAAERLTARNRRLRATHLSLLQQIARLLQLDLARERSRFGELVESVRRYLKSTASTLPCIFVHTHTILIDTSPILLPC